jgi:beta-phosphoglucomutase
MAAALWDLDGTLIDSAEQHWISWHRTMAGEAFTLTREQFRASFGQRNDRILRTWLGPDTPDATIRRIGDAKESAYRQLMREGGIAGLPGAREWIDRLAARGWQQAIASSAPRLNVEAVLEVLDWQGKFDAIVAAEDVRRGKPDPEVFLTAAARLGAAPSDCVVIEDAAPGVAAAHAGGMRVIGVGPETAAADLHVPALTALDADAFDRLIGRARAGRSRS